MAAMPTLLVPEAAEAPMKAAEAPVSAASTPSYSSASGRDVILANVTLRGELSTFNTAAFVPRLAQLLGVQPAEVEVLAITPAHAGRYAQQAALTASRAAAQALALVPEGLPSELTSKLRAIEHDANDVAAIAQARQAGTLAMRISAVVPRAVAQADAASLHSDLPALSSALGAEVLGPIAFEMSALS